VPSSISGESNTTLCFAVILSIQVVSHFIEDAGGIGGPAAGVGSVVADA
jgi:hypothetical protein